MKIINPSYIIEDEFDGDEILKRIERFGRTCYKSENRIDSESSKVFVKNIIKRGHESVLEHEKISVRIICDRGISHEIVRHRIASYSQESTRYCNYGAEKFGSELTFISPFFWEDEEHQTEYEIWKKAMQSAEDSYFSLLARGAKPEEARSVLPNSLKTELIMTMNLREWRHFFKMRASKYAHPQMKQIAGGLLKEFKDRLPIVFDDIDGDIKDRQHADE